MHEILGLLTNPQKSIQLKVVEATNVDMFKDALGKHW